MKASKPSRPIRKKIPGGKSKKTGPSRPLLRRIGIKAAPAGRSPGASLRNQEFLNALMDNISDYIYFKDKDSRFLRINAAHARAFGLSDPAQAIGKTDFDFFTEAHARQAYADEQEIIRTGRPIIGLVEKETRADGRVSWVSTTKMPLSDSRKRIIGTFGISRDVTAQKLAEKALRRNEEWQRDILANMTDWVWEIDTKGYFTHTSEKGETILGVPREEIIGRRPFDFLSPEDAGRLAGAFPEKSAEKLVVHDVEIWIAGRDGRKVCLLTNAVPILDEDGNLEGYRGVNKDITERKRAEELIQRQLEEKTILLKEVHHRIKNNIASIDGLLTLHLRATENPEAAAVLKESLGRVRSMGILYEKLLRTEGYEQISVKTYVESLTASVMSLFPEQSHVALDLRVDDFDLDSKRMFSLGIILNEILTNTMKYAFLGRERGAIKLSVANTDGRVTLSLQDDGRGLPEGFEPDKSKGFGLMLVRMLSEQLEGSFSIISDGGTRSTLTFKV